MTSEEEQGGVMIEAEERDVNQERLGPDSPGASGGTAPSTPMTQVSDTWPLELQEKNVCCSGYYVCCDLSPQQKGTDTADQSGSRTDVVCGRGRVRRGLTFGLRSRGMGSSGSSGRSSGLDSKHLQGVSWGPSGCPGVLPGGAPLDPTASLPRAS